MSETKHTEGPWSPMWQNSRQKGGYHWEVPIQVGDGIKTHGNTLCDVYMGGPAATNSTKETVEANARLIAASPDMLEALKAVVVDYDECVRIGMIDMVVEDNVISLVRAAISKAEGSPSEASERTTP